MELIDTHCHIYYNSYKNDINDVIKTALDNKVKKMICVAVDLDSAKKCIDLSKKFSSIYATAGFHPHESKDAKSTYLKQIEEMFENKKVLAVGETGLDYYYNHSDKKTQIKIFTEQLELAKTMNKPTIIHCREAENDIIKCIKNTRIDKGVIHCFSGNEKFANQILEYGLYISFTGLITFNKKLQETMKKIPLNKIMLETDSPYLTPIPNRGKRNEPWMVKIIAEKISELKNIDIKEVADITTKNAKRLFGI